MVESVLADPQRIVLFASDLMSTTRIRATVERLGYQLQVIDGESPKGGDNTSEVNPLQAEPVEGPESLLFDKLTRWSPALIIIDLGDDRIPWRRFLSSLKASPATRRLPVVCYGPHIHSEILREAENLSADIVVPRSKFFSGMTTIIENYARNVNPELMKESCGRNLPPIAEKGLRAFNNREFFDAHELLEDAWNDDSSTGRDFYRALIQVSVAYLQIERSNYRGAYKMLLRSRQWFRLIPDVCHGVDMRALRDDAESVYQTLVRLGPDNIADFEPAMLRPVKYTSFE
jgi:predicted metal-dependent hydrolase